MSATKLLSLLNELENETICRNIGKRLIWSKNGFRSIKELRNRALAGDPFFFGCALPEHVQAIVDRITLDTGIVETLHGILSGEVYIEDLPFVAVYDKPQGAYLITLSRTGIGFYVCIPDLLPSKFQHVSPLKTTPSPKNDRGTVEKTKKTFNDSFKKKKKSVIYNPPSEDKLLQLVEQMSTRRYAE